MAVDELVVKGRDVGKGTFSDSESGLRWKDREALRWWRDKGWADDQVP